VALQRTAEDEVPESKCFGYVQIYDDKPRRRLFEFDKVARVAGPSAGSVPVGRRGGGAASARSIGQSGTTELWERDGVA